MEPGTGGRAVREERGTTEVLTITEQRRKVPEELCSRREERRSCTGSGLIRGEVFPACGLVLET